MSGSDAALPAPVESIERQLALLVETVSDYAIFLLDPDGHVASWNRGAQRIKGYRAEEIIGRHFSAFYTDEDRARDHPARELEIASQEGRYEEEGWRVRKDGSMFWANVVITAVRSDEGALIGYAKVTRDLTERRAAEQALRAKNEELTRANRELDRFASVAAHDLREPLRTVAGFSELLVARYEDQLDERAQGYLLHITAANVRMERLVDGLLHYARSGDAAQPAHRVVVLGCVEVVLEDLQGAIAERDAELRVAVPDDVAVMCTEQDLSAVLRNLVSNAVKFANPQRPEVRIRARRVEDGWRIEVADNGIGIDAADRPRIFDAFQRLHSPAEYPGTGLGLAIAQRVLERHGGAIGVDTTEGPGSLFWFVLPAG
jgi:PAS domain S-box-containing protein